MKKLITQTRLSGSLGFLKGLRRSKLTPDRGPEVSRSVKKKTGLSRRRPPQRAASIPPAAVRESKGAEGGLQRFR